MCGFMINKEEIEGFISDFDYIKQIQEERMMKLIYNEIKEKNKFWLQGQIFNEIMLKKLSLLIFEDLIKDTIIFFK